MNPTTFGRETTEARLRSSGVTLFEAFTMTDDQILRLACCGRKTLRGVRALQHVGQP